MNKKDLVPVILLALLIPLWMFIDRSFIAPKFPAPEPTKIEQQEETPPVAILPVSTTLSEAVESEKESALVEETTASITAPTEEIITELSNKKLKLELTSLGGGIKTAILSDYPELNEPDSPPVVLDFSDSAALVYKGLPGISSSDSLNIQKSPDSSSVTFSKILDSGVIFQRTISFATDYLLNINDRFINNGSSPWSIPSARILTGRMENPADTETMKGISILGVDSYTPSEEVNYWGKKLSKLYKNAEKAASIDVVPDEMIGQPVTWVAAKNKFFTQIISQTNTVATMAILSSRDMQEKGIIPKDITAALTFQPMTIAAGNSLNLDYSYYLGPKKYSILKESGNSMEKVMEFETIGFWSGMNILMEPARKFLLWTMNTFYNVFPNYGIAIILLTLLIRILFWPLTHKSTESMRRMQEIQPEIKAIQAKYKGKKDQASMQRMQAETMALYKEKKVNPMGGCLPMFVQIPVFIALFTVLRNAIELRYAGFLWIADLSTAENLFAGKIPFVGSLNILPIVMSLSMIWQQKLTSPGTAMTPEQEQQQKMMMFMMPIMMLFFFYTMPSGLVLYWTTSNLLMIAQTGIRNLKKKKEA